MKIFIPLPPSKGDSSQIMSPFEGGRGMKQHYLLTATISTIFHGFMLKVSVVFILSWLFSHLLFGQGVNDKNYIAIGDSTLTKLADEAVLEGKIIDAETQSPVSKANVFIEKLEKGITTDKNGLYRIVLPTGLHQIKIQYVGMQAVVKNIFLYSSGRLDILMKEETVDLDEIIVEGKAADENIREVTTGIEKLNIKEIKKLPAFLGEVDVVKSLLLLPGVQTVGEGASGFNVRGGRTDQNLVLQNGAPLFNTSHVLGFFSVFNPDVTEDFSLYKGFIPAQYGGRISSVLDVSLRDGNDRQYKVQGGVGLVSSRLAVEGPVIKGKTSFLAGARISYSDWILRQVKQINVRQSAASFYDINAALSHRFSDRSRLSLSFYQSDDYFRYSNQYGYTWGTQLGNARWRNLITPSLLSVSTAVYGDYSSTFFDPEGFDSFRLQNGIQYLQFKQNFLYTYFDQHTINAGAEWIRYDSKPETSAPYAETSTVVAERIEKEQGRELSWYVNDEIVVNSRISVAVGLRYSSFQNVGPYPVLQYQDQVPSAPAAITDTVRYAKGDVVKQYGGLEPRVAARFSLGKSNSLKLSYNRMRQYIHLISNSTAPTPVDIWQLSNTYLPPQRADNFSIGYFHNFRDNTWETSLEFYYKKMDHLLEYKDFARLLLNSHLETELLIGKGKAYGSELYIKRNKGKWTGWLSYAYTRTVVQASGQNPEESINRGDWYPANYDKPHNLTLVAQRQLGKEGAFAANFTYSSGRPISAVVSSYETSGLFVPVFSSRNEYRIPDYYRLDISFTTGKLFSKGKRYQDNMSFSVYNLLSRNNAFSVFYQRAEGYFIPVPHKLSVLGAAFPAITYNFSF